MERAEERRKRPSERHERENCDGVEVFLENQRENSKPRASHA